jgi:hypothetical protein
VLLGPGRAREVIEEAEQTARENVDGELPPPKPVPDHCEPMGLGIRDARIYDWLDGYLRARSG